jgi:acetolactate synthase-1/2/3 large subunit
MYPRQAHSAAQNAPTQDDIGGQMSVSMQAVSVGAATDRAKRVADRIVSWLAERGVRRIYGIPGGAIAPVYDALIDSGIELVACQHEMTATYMACGEARATGMPGVVAVTSGPGVLNTVSAVAAAMQDELPLVVLAGDVRSDWSGRGAIQDGSERGLDILSVFRSIARLCATIDEPAAAHPTLAAAWEAATRHPRGPVLVRIPVDVASSDLPGLPQPTTVTVAPPAHPEPGVIEQIAQRLARARRPLVLAGIGARTAGVGEELERLLHRVRAPLVTDIEAKGIVAEGHPLSLGVLGIGSWPQALRYARSGVDVLLTVGARLDDTSTLGFGLCPDAALIQLDHDASRLHRSRRAEVAVVSDLRAALSMLVDAAPRLTGAALVAREIEIVAARGAAEPESIDESGPVFDPRAAIRLLQREVGKDAIYVSDIGNHVVFSGRHLQTEHPSRFVVSHGLGSMGSGFGTAIGLALAHRGARRVVAIVGDGGLLMVGNDLATCARYGIPLLVAVMDNQQLAMVDQGMNALYGRSGCSELPSVDFVGYARSLGVVAETVDCADDISDLAAIADKQTVVARIPVDPSVPAVNARVAGFQGRQVSR